MFNDGANKRNVAQEEAINTLDRNIIVSAGAGSGKTKVLTDRFVHIVETGISPENILAITFTNKAANEMKERIRKRMWEKEREEDASKWGKRILELENAQIGTIHGLCSRILMENPLEAGLAPGAELVEDYDLGQFDDECLNSFLREKISANDTDVIELLTKVSLGDFAKNINKLKNKAFEIFHYSGDIESSKAELLKKYDVAPDSDIVAMEKHLLNISMYAPVKKKVPANVTRVQDNREQIVRELHDSPLSFMTYDQTFHINKDGACFSCKAVQSDIDELERHYKRINAIEKYNSAGKRYCELWLNVLEKYVNYFETEKKKANLLTFDDMEEKTLLLLESNSAIRHKYQGQFTYIMVDEFQDTNEKQKGIIYLLYGESPDKLEKLAEGSKKSLFVVGDPKQSIYRFRGADVGVFHKVRKDIEDLGEHGSVISMNTNYRSSAKIVSACNTFFPSVMGTDDTKAVFFEGLESGNGEEGTDVELLFVHTEDGIPKPVFRQIEMETIADRISALHGAGEKYGDIAILMRAMTHVDDVISALQEKGIPYVVSGGKDFYEVPEVYDLVMICKAVCSNNNTLELVSALRSPYFGFDERQITDLFIGGNVWDGLKAYASSDERCQKAFTILSELKRKAKTLGLAEFWKTAWDLLDVERVLLQYTHGDIKLANVQKLQQGVLDFAEEKNGSLVDWTERIVAMHKSGCNEKCAVVPANDAVTVITIHGAKGLQYPTVFIPMLDARDNEERGVKANFASEGGLGVKVLCDDLEYAETTVFLDAFEEEKSLDDEEKARILYVAMTRAGKNLILSGVGKEVKEIDQGALKSISWFKQFYNVKIRKMDNFCEFVRREDQPEKETAEAIEQTSVERLEQVAPLPGYTFSGISSFTPTALQCYSHCPRSYYYQYVLNIPVLEEKGIDDKARKIADYRGELEAKEFGNLLHRALELYVKCNCERDKLRETFDKSLEDNRLSGDYGEAWDLLQKYVDSPLFLNTVGSAKERLTELHFTYNLSGKYMVKGIIDCLNFDADGNMHIVDYKTGGYHESDEGYAIQLAIYSEVANNLYGKDGKKVLDANLHYLPELKHWSLGHGGKEDFLDKAKENCRRIVEGRTEEDFPKDENSNCRNCGFRFMCMKSEKGNL